jgi:CHAT domain-containing protein
MSKLNPPEKSKSLKLYRRCLEIAEELKEPDSLNRSRVQLGAALLKQGHSQEAENLFAHSYDVPEYWTRLTCRLWTGLARSTRGDHLGALAAYSQVDSLLGPDAPADIVLRLAVEQGRALQAIGKPAQAAAAYQRARSLEYSGIVDSEVLGRFNDNIQREIAEAYLGLLFDHPELLGDHERPSFSRELAAWGRTGGWVGEGPVQSDAPPRVEFFMGSKRAFVWVCGSRSENTQWLELPPAEQLRSWVRAAVTDLSYPDRPLDLELMTRLSGALLQPALEVWTPGNRLEILPDGPLTRLPWAALPLGQESLPALDRGSLIFLVEGLDRSRANDKDGFDPAQCRVLVMGSNSGTEPAEEPGLFHAEQEAREVAALWNIDQVDLRLGDATHWTDLSAGPMANFDLIHIASHTVVSEGFAGQSAIRMAGVSLERPLTIPEISGLPLKAELVFLSSCEGGRLHHSSGIGLVSFASAFLHAGSKSVIASSLAVEDETARDLATSFYAHWRGGMEGAAALRAAQMEIRDSGPKRNHPFYWSSFRLYRPAG